MDTALHLFQCGPVLLLPQVHPCARGRLRPADLGDPALGSRWHGFVACRATNTKIAALWAGDLDASRCRPKPTVYQGSVFTRYFETSRPDTRGNFVRKQSRHCPKSITTIHRDCPCSVTNVPQCAA